MLKIKIRQSENGEWYGVLLSRNQKEVWETKRKYKRKAGAENAVQLLQDTFSAIGLN